MAIGATEYNMSGGMHRLDALVALIASDTLRFGLRLRLVDQVARGERRLTRNRCFRWNRRRRTITGSGILRVCVR